MVEEYSAKPEGYDPREASSNNCIVMLGHFISLITQKENDPRSEPVDLSKIVSVWRKPKPHLHIDGGSMGGGGPVKHKDPITFDEVRDEYRGESPDWNKYLSKERVGIFHYCLFAHNEEGYNPITNPVAGRSVTGGWHFAVYDAGRISKTQSCCFIHELGHNLGLKDIENLFGDKDTCMNYYNDGKLVDYSKDEWNKIDIKGCIEGVSP